MRRKKHSETEIVRILREAEGTLTEQDVDPDEIVRCFTKYMAFVGTAATRAQFGANMAAKLNDALFVHDIAPLLRPGMEYDIHSAWDLVHESLVRRLPGEPRKGAAI